jgi:hypothetical protein
MAVGISVAVVVLSYVEDNVGWVLEFGIPCLIMADYLFFTKWLIILIPV